MTKLIQNLITTKENKIDLEKSSLDTNTTYVGGFKNNKTQRPSSQENRHNFYNDKKMAKTVLSRTEIKKLQKDKNIRFRHQYCGYISQAEFVKLKKSNEDNYYYSGTASCSNVWRCPSCSLKIMKGRAKEIYQVMSAHDQTEQKMGFVTFTIQHSKKDSLDKSLNYIHKKYRAFQQTWFFKELRKSGKLIGQIKSTEHTLTNKNGWHPHLHNIFFWSFKTEEEVDHYQKLIIEKWAKYSKGSINAQYQKAVYSVEEISDYITKWDAVQELTNDFQKSGKGISPFQMLSIITQKKSLFGSTDHEKNKAKLISLYSEYIEATKGKRRLIISKNLLYDYRVITKTDEELTKQDIEKSHVISFTRPLWKTIYKNDLQPYLIDQCYRHKEKHLQQSGIIEVLQEFELLDFYENNENEITLKII